MTGLSQFGPEQRWLREVLARLPIADRELDDVVLRHASASATDVAMLHRANAIARSLSTAPRPALPAELVRPGFAQQLIESIGRDAEQKLGSLLRAALQPVPAPSALDARTVLAAVHVDAANELEHRLRETRAGDALAEGFAPLRAPKDTDWATAALEDLERSHGPAAERITLGDPARTPGWLWARIRGDVRGRVLAFRRRRNLMRATLVAATLLVSGLVYVAVSPRPNTTPASRPTIVFRAVDTPLTDEFSAAAVVRRMRDGR